MGFTSEQQIYTQLRKAQGETNARLDALLAAQRETKELLRWLGTVLAASPKS